MWFLTRMLRVSWKDKYTKEITGTTRQFLSVITNRRLKYMRHAVRNKKTNLIATYIVGNLIAKEKKRPAASSIITNVKSITGMPLGALVHLPEDRMQWRTMIIDVSSDATLVTVSK